MRNLWLTLAMIFTLAVVAVPSFADDCDGGPFDIDDQQATACLPYEENGLYTKELPMAGDGGPTDETLSNSADIVERVFKSQYGHQTDWLGIQFSTPGVDDTGYPIYYGQSTDPIYEIKTCMYCSAALGTFWHIPENARFSTLYGSTHYNDGFLVVWDQTNDKVLMLYLYGPLASKGNPSYAEKKGILPDCSATTEETACEIDVYYAQISDYTDDEDYQLSESGGNSLRNAVLSLTPRHQEMYDATAAEAGGTPSTLGHALYLNSPCVNQNGSSVFPAVDNYVYTCNAPDTFYGTTPMDNDPSNRPVQGNLFFLDYTDAQITAMSIPAWQKVMIRTLSHYGMYQGDTTGSIAYEANIARVEGSEAYEYDSLTSDWMSWLATNYSSTGWIREDNAPDPTYSSTYEYYVKVLTANNIPDLEGPNCLGSTCGILDHMHVANECVALGMAGEAGGCLQVPTVTITSPASDPYATGSATVALAGTASATSPATVSSVGCVIDTGGGCSVSGTTSWSVAAAAIDAGANVATLTVTDSNSDTNTDTITLNRYTLSSVSAGTPEETSATITWTTNLAGDTEVQYGPTDAYGLSAETSESVTSHSQALTGLASGTEYHYKVCTEDVCSSDDTFTTDSADPTPVLSNVVVTTVGFYSVTITWTTDPAGDSYVNYGLTTAYGSSAGQAESVTSHSVTISGLSLNTQYHFEANSTNEGSTGVASDSTFTTAAASRSGRVRAHVR